MSASSSRARISQIANNIKMRIGEIESQIKMGENRCACIIHVYHEDLFEEISGYIDNLPKDTDIFFTIVKDKFEVICEMVRGKYPIAHCYPYENRGRDILPFLQILSLVIDLGYKAICKIHTKKSSHLGVQGAHWRRELMKELLGSPIVVARCLKKIKYGAGLVVPTDYLLNCNRYISKNTLHFTRLLERMGAPDEIGAQVNYPGGSMFWFAPGALRPLLALNLQPEDFEKESGQLDGTLAHAIERAFGVACTMANLDCVGTSDASYNWGYAIENEIDHRLARKCVLRRETAPIQVIVSSAHQITDLERTHASLSAQILPVAAVIPIAATLPLTQALRQSSAPWTLLMCAGDMLSKTALALLSQSIAQHVNEKTHIIYFDHDELDADNVPQRPILKPSFNHDLLLSYPYMGRSLLVKTDWLFAHMDGATACDLALTHRLALAEVRESGGMGFLRVPMVLAHLSSSESSVFATTSEAWQTLANELTIHLAQTEPGSQVLEGPAPGTFHVVPPLPHMPLVSIVIPTRDQLPFLSRCIDSLLSNTDYPAFEILIVDNDSQTTEAREFLAGLSALGTDQIRVLSAPGPFNFSRMNNLAVAQARGEFILLLNNDTAALQPDWLGHMVRHALRDGVGIVGARLLYPDGKVQHAGVIMGLRGPAEHPCLGLDNAEPGYLFRAQVTQNFSAVTAACMLVSKAVYEEVGGLDEVTFGVSYNDIDFCLRVGQTGRRIVWTPLATLLHEGSASQKAGIENKSQAQKVQRFGKEQEAMYLRWPAVIANDPAYNPNLSLVERGYEIEANPLLCFNKFQGVVEHRIAAFAADNQGCGNYRMLQPLQAMLNAGLCTGGASPEIFSPNLALRSGADTLIFQRPNSEVMLANLKALTPLKGIKKIYEVDDHLARVPIKSAHYEHMPKDLRGKMLKAIGLCDRLVVSTEPLARELGSYNGDVRVVLNRIPPAMWGAAPPQRVSGAARAERRKPKVGWAGGVGHLGDLEMITGVIKDLADTVDWVFFGMCPDSIRPYVREFHTGIPTLEYPHKLMELAQDWDLAIAPLESNPFNDCKSNLKLLEYGWCGVPVVCSDVLPYQCDLPATRVKNRHKNWREAILERVTNLEASRQEGLALQQRIATDWMLTGDNLQHWYHAWTD